LSHTKGGAQAPGLGLPGSLVGPTYKRNHGRSELWISEGMRGAGKIGAQGNRSRPRNREREGGEGIGAGGRQVVGDRPFEGSQSGAVAETRSDELPNSIDGKPWRLSVTGLDGGHEWTLPFFFGIGGSVGRRIGLGSRDGESGGSEIYGPAGRPGRGAQAGI